ncbi:SDR family oxidoreductase [Isoptericola sp. b441]|uniref:SDR family oxidoreductase n=1 Tax=Actinotalea lenta TaxID=3064654 RepID=A0ABT9D8M4_9CELL|nr:MULTISPECIES: SDR family oxidoreductase [unclassified Isoptericola]MDO8107236.1 SDR family oxidoreductase [Isoptericola sp. b441]MDO8121101.1 SDR family oxidoreductase [Isoptericola sp. b490]
MADGPLGGSRPLVCAVTGVTGYVGGRLVPELLAAGHAVRAVARLPGRLRDRPWYDGVETVEADAGDLDAMRAALSGVDVAYYLIHSLAGGRRFEARDRRVARTFAQAAREAGVRRIVYLGGLHPDVEDLSPHMESRKEVGEIFLASGVPTTVLRAAVILGSGSASFEMMRYLTERLPAMTVPRWVDNRVQPIAIRDVLHYLVGSATMPADVNRSFDIGGPDVLTYRQMMQRYAAVAGLRPRVIVPVGVLTPRLSSLWVSLVTPVPAAIARPLVDSLIHEVVCTEHDIAQWVPDPADGLAGFDRAVRLALNRIAGADVATRWSSAAVPGAPSDPLPSDPGWAGGSLYRDDRERYVHAPAEVTWGVVQEIGGEHGWYSWPLAWRLRGLIDRVVGGPGLRRGRRDPTTLWVDDPVDFWRVEEVETGHLLRLRAEMRLPGLAWLELEVTSEGDGSRLRQAAIYHPHGLPGHLYWWSVAPFHGVVFGPMHRGMAAEAERRAVSATPTTGHRAPSPASRALRPRRRAPGPRSGG